MGGQSGHEAIRCSSARCGAAGAPTSYTGEAVNPANISWLESMLGVGRAHQHSAQTPAKEDPGAGAVQDC